MSNIKVKLIKSGVSDLLKSPEVKNMLREHAKATLENLGDGYGTRETLTDRAGVNVFAETYKARYENLNENTILKALS